MMQASGFFHIHSGWSYDSELGLEQIRESCLANGAKFAVLAEHSRDFPWGRLDEYLAAVKAISDYDFLFLSGIEYEFSGIHLVAFGCERYLPHEDINECIAACRDGGGGVVWAHPRKRDFRSLKSWASRLDGIEVWSARYGCRYLPDPGLCRRLKELRKTFPDLRGYGALDAHGIRDFRGPRLSLNIDVLCGESLLAELKKGKFKIEHKGISIPSSGQPGWARGLLHLFYGGYRFLDWIVP